MRRSYCCTIATLATIIFGAAAHAQLTLSALEVFRPIDAVGQMVAGGRLCNYTGNLTTRLEPDTDDTGKIMFSQILTVVGHDCVKSQFSLPAKPYSFTGMGKTYHFATRPEAEAFWRSITLLAKDVYLNQIGKVDGLTVEQRAAYVAVVSAGASLQDIEDMTLMLEQAGLEVRGWQK